MPPPDDAARTARFEQLWDDTHVAVLAFALRRAATPADAADVVAETFLVAWRRLDDVPEGDAARPWLLGVARLVTANGHRSAHRSSALAQRLGRDLATVAGAVRPAAAQVEAIAVRAALARLAPRDRDVLLLAGWEGLTGADLAVALGCSQVAARVRLHRARGRFAKALAAEGADVPASEEVRS